MPGGRAIIDIVMSPRPALLTPSEALRLFNRNGFPISRSSLYRAIASGRILTSTALGRPFVVRAHVERLISNARSLEVLARSDVA